MLNTKNSWLHLFFWSKFCLHFRRIFCSSAFSDGKFIWWCYFYFCGQNKQMNSEFFKNASRILTRKAAMGFLLDLHAILGCIFMTTKKLYSLATMVQLNCTMFILISFSNSIKPNYFKKQCFFVINFFT